MEGLVERMTALALSYLVRTQYQFTNRESNNGSCEEKEPGLRTKGPMLMCDRHRNSSLQHLPGRNVLLMSHTKRQEPTG